MAKEKVGALTVKARFYSLISKHNGQHFLWSSYQEYAKARRMALLYEMEQIIFFNFFIKWVFYQTVRELVLVSV